MRAIRGVLVLGLCIGVLGRAGVAGAQPVEDASSYAALIDGAVEEFERGNWAEAEALFARAHALEPNARTLRGMGVCAYESKQYVRALVHLRAALGEQNKALTDTQRAEVSGIIERASGFVARLELVVEPAEATLLVDSRPPTLDDERRVLLDPGQHELTLSHAGHGTEVRTVHVRAAEATRLEVVLELVGAQGTGRVASAGDDSGAGLSTWAWLSAGAAVAFAGAGAIVLVSGNAGVEAVEMQCPKDECTSAALERAIDDEHLEALQVGAVVGFALGGALAATAIALFVAQEGAVEHEPTAALQLELGAGALTLRGRY